MADNVNKPPHYNHAGIECIEAIHAALHPEEGSSLYFVARGDGGHYFSDTLDEHRKAVRRYQIDGRTEDYQSAPTKP